MAAVANAAVNKVGIVPILLTNVSSNDNTPVNEETNPLRKSDFIRENAGVLLISLSISLK